MFEFNACEGFGLMEMLARFTGADAKDALLQLPETLGKGYIKNIALGPFMNMMIHRYELFTDVKGRRNAVITADDTVVFSFRNVFREEEGREGRTNRPSLPAVQVSSTGMDIDLFFPAGSRINTIIITVRSGWLKELISGEETNTLMDTILPDNKPYCYEEMISPVIQTTATAILVADMDPALLNFHYKLKAQELIFLFLQAFRKRKDIIAYPLNAADAQTIYQVRDKIIADLSRPPQLPDLARLSGMSESKLNRLFKQVFGHTIYNYHQQQRIHEAAYLIRNRKVSVSEAGYELGFANLSHFSRIFERYIGMKPKKYGMQ